MPDIEGPEEASGIGSDKHLLKSLRRGAPHREAIVVVVVGGRGELLALNEPGGLAMAELLDHPGQGEAEMTEAVDAGGITGPIQHTATLAGARPGVRSWPVDKTQLGRAGELALALYAMVSSDGELQLFTPIADDDHVDATAGRRGGLPAIAIQVKTGSYVDRSGAVEAKADYPAAHVREHPAFIYAVLRLESVAITSAWLVPSPDFNRLTYRRITGDREILEFRGDPQREDRFSPFRLPALEIGPHLLSIIDSLEQKIPHDVVARGTDLMYGRRLKAGEGKGL